jgi:hypothetical protein
MSTKISLRPLTSEHDIPLLLDFGILLVVEFALIPTVSTSYNS